MKRLAPAWFVGSALVVAELACGLRYPLFRDELYYLACADHLAWGYVDQPPLSIGALWLFRALFGDSQLAVRMLPALLGLVRVLLVGRLTRRLGGSTVAQSVAAILAAFTPVMLGVHGYFSMNAFDFTFWALAFVLVAELLDGASPRHWLYLGLVVGVGLLNKWSLLFFLAGLGVGVVLTPLRRALTSWQLWAGLLIAAVLQTPHVWWQWQQGWPTLEFISNATQFKNVALSPFEFLLGQVQEVGPMAVPFWVAGLGWLLFRKTSQFRALGLIYLVAFGIFAGQHGKPYYLAPAYPPLFAAAGVLVERLPRPSPRWSAVALTLLLQLPAAPFAIPVLPVEQFVAYSQALGVMPTSGERSRLGPLPQFFADRFGWLELTERVAKVYRSLSPADQARVLIVADNYGEAGAIDYYGHAFGLPKARSQHNSYYVWAPAPASIEVAILVGQDLEGPLSVFRSCEPMGPAIESPWAMPYEKENPILLCRELTVPAAEAWVKGRHFI